MTTDRGAQALAAKEAGQTWEQIGRHLGVTGNRASQLAERARRRRAMLAARDAYLGPMGTFTWSGWLQAHAPKGTNPGLITIALHRLKRADIDGPDELVGWTRARLLRIEGLGDKALRLIEQCLENDGGRKLGDVREIGLSMTRADTAHRVAAHLCEGLDLRWKSTGRAVGQAVLVAMIEQAMKRPEG